MFKINESNIIDICGNMSTYLKGRTYYLNNRVKELEYIPEFNLFKSVVVGSRYYYVEVMFDSEGYFKYASCSCPAYEKYWGHCKHIIAVLFTIIDKQNLSRIAESLIY